MGRILLKNGKVVNEGTIQELDVLIDGDIISKIASGISDASAKLLPLWSSQIQFHRQPL